MNKNFLHIFLCVIVVAAIMATLSVFRQQANGRLNGFKRKLNPPLKLDTVVDLTYPNYYFSGSTSSSIYLSNHSARALILKVNANNLDTQVLFLKDPESIPIDWNSSLMQVDSPTLFIMDGTTPAIIRGSIETLRLQTQNYCTHGFYQSLAFSPSSFILRTFDSLLQQRTLSVVRDDSLIRTDRPAVITKQVDGVFCTDGKLIADANHRRFVFFYFYRNELISLDTMLRVKFRARSIDTSNTVKIQLASMTNGKINTFSGPPPLVNRRGGISRNVLFIQSMLRADNEPADITDDNILLDRYSMEDGHYLSSVHLPIIPGKKLHDLLITDKYIWALFDEQLVRYDVTQDNLSF